MFKKINIINFHNSSTFTYIPTVSAQNFSIISEATCASSFQNPNSVMQSLSSFCRLSVSGFVVLYCPFVLPLILGNSHLTVRRIGPSNLLGGTC
ncbi:hypothetical protein HMPREF1227_0089 [Streptococcus pyogenes GA41046]|nr:hypothetical protein HMPREF1227_0089 [Streptococcus pyogenes GA41046]